MLAQLDSLIVFSGIGVSFFLMIFLLKRPLKKGHDWLLIYWFSLVIFHLLFFKYNHLLISYDYIILGFGGAIPVLHIIIIYLYCHTLKNGVKLGHLIGNLSVYLVYVIAFIFFAYSQGLEVRGMSLVFTEKAPAWSRFIAPSFLLVYIYYLRHILKLIRSFKVNLLQLYSNLNLTKVEWLYYWVYSYIISSMIVVVIILIADYGILDVSLAFLIVALIITIQMFLIGQIGIVSNFRFPDTKSFINSEKKYKGSGLKKESITLLKESLLKLLDDESLHLNSELNLNDIAKELNLPVYQASQLINEGFNKTFFDLINSYRIKEFKRRLEDQRYRHLTLLGIAFDSGFNSKSGFYKVFKEATGQTPRQYKESITKK